MNPLFTKLFVTILAGGLAAAGLLALRQQRLDIAHRIAEVHGQIVRQDRSLWEFQAEIARRCRPEEIQRAVERLGGDWRPVPPARISPDLGPPVPPQIVESPDDRGRTAGSSGLVGG